jgi:hypothetical protein
MPGSIWLDAQIGDPVYQGLTLGGVIINAGAWSFLKADHPGLRALRINNGVPILVGDLPDSQSIPASATVDLYY